MPQGITRHPRELTLHWNHNVLYIKKTSGQCPLAKDIGTPELTEKRRWTDASSNATS